MRFPRLMLLTLFLSGCASYKPHPLDTRVQLPKEVRIQVDPHTLNLPQLHTHRFDPRDGLDEDEVAMLAVANNPEITTARAKVGETRAQAFNAGLLPDPQVGLTGDYPTHGPSGSTSAFNLGVTFDVAALLLRSSSRAAARNDLHAADLDLLWQEWQAANQGRLLFLRIIMLEKERALLAGEQELFASRYRDSHAALEAGLRTIDAASSDFAALQGVNQRIDDLDRRILRNRHDLNALMGLDPDVQLDLVGEFVAAPLDETAVAAALPLLPRRRPDLLALQWGYQAQEARVRKAVLAQFQPFTLGFTRARDTSNVNTIGFALTLVLPLFNGSRGQIAIASATRERLRDEFRQRLVAAQTEVRAMLEEGRLMEAQLAAVQSARQALDQAATEGEASLKQGEMDELAYVQLAGAAIDKAIEELTLEEALGEQRIGLEILLGAELPPSDKPPS